MTAVRRAATAAVVLGLGVALGACSGGTEGGGGTAPKPGATTAPATPTAAPSDTASATPPTAPSVTPSATQEPGSPTPSQVRISPSRGGWKVKTFPPFTPPTP
ncbi:hypothetical protein ACIRSU_20725 [Streptomyces sp. NPDC101160]|uniref:hypothetical protein n=1 Tax=Streptomyces sp. NPDC101160 TaxID=3366118 RepID=UPI0037F96020